MFSQLGTACAHDHTFWEFRVRNLTRHRSVAMLQRLPGRKAEACPTRSRPLVRTRGACVYAHVHTHAHAICNWMSAGAAPFAACSAWRAGEFSSSHWWVPNSAMPPNCMHPWISLGLVHEITGAVTALATLCTTHTHACPSTHAPRGTPMQTQMRRC